MNGVVVKSTGSWYRILMEGGKVVECRIRGKIKLQGIQSTNPIAVGDKVDFEWETQEQTTGIITSIVERTNCLVRKSVNLSKKSHVLAANVDRCYLLVTLAQPETSLLFVDRFLVAAESFRIPVTLLFNKADLYGEKEKKLFTYCKELYEKIGYLCVDIDARNDKHIAFLRQEIKGKQVLFAGHSGTGKSTLTHSIDSSLILKTGEISKYHLQGKHTTTFAEMYPVKSGGFIIDTPGIKAFGLIDIDKSVLGHYFPEMREGLNQCKFHNCQHINEPDCWVKQQVKQGEISSSRYENYLQMMEEESTHRKSMFE